MLFSILFIGSIASNYVTASPVKVGITAKRSISSGPLLPDNFPDPSFIKVDDTYYAFGTGFPIPVATSPDFNTWSMASGPALDKVGAWSNGANVWAPDVVQLANGKFVLYYTAQKAGGDSNAPNCVGAATSDSVTGPYTALDDALVCSDDQGGAIDPAGFQDADGQQYVVYKIDGNHLGGGGACGNADGSHATPLMLQEVSADDGVTPVEGSAAQELLDRGQYDGPLIEAPSLTRIADEGSAGGWLYLLFFSSNCYNTDLYDTSYAYSTNGITNGGQPYTKAKEPLLVTGTSGLYAPGGLDVGPDVGLDNHVVFHADIGQDVKNGRQMYGGELNIDVGGRTVTI